LTPTTGEVLRAWDHSLACQPEKGLKVLKTW
jgi:hypothetical protein